MTTKIYGASDDLIEVEGDEINEEFNYYPGYPRKDDDNGRYLGFSDGTLLRIYYDSDGIWRIVKLRGGESNYGKQEGEVEADTNDVVTLSGVKLRWVVFGKEIGL